MQEKEFDNLMMGAPAKWAEMPKGMKPTLQDVKEREKPIMAMVRKDIDSFIEGLRSNGYTETKIRRLTKKEFNIQIVK